MNDSSKRFVENLRNRRLLPARVEVAEWCGWTLVSCYDHARSKFISEGVAMGIDKNPDVALLKGLTEYCERRLSVEGGDPVAYLTKRSDGLAAFPQITESVDGARTRARENALNEATERYLWAMWWDLPQSSFELVAGDQCAVAADISNLVLEFNLRSVREVRVSESNGEKTLSILLAETRDGGFVTGGAASSSTDELRRLTPAFGELLRHLVVLRNMGSSVEGLSFYESRLHGFGSGAWSYLVRERLRSGGSKVISLPALMVDREVKHNAMDLVSVHRCLFRDQPEFMGGRVDRLCI